MALLTLLEIHEGRSGDDEISSKENSKSSRTRKFRATVSSPFDGPDVVLAALDPLGSPHPVAADCYLMKRHVDNFAKSKTVFIATQSYSTDPVVGQNPSSDPPQYKWGTEQVSRPYDVALGTSAAGHTGIGVLNSAGQPFVPPPNDSDAYWTVTVEKNQSFIPVTILGFRNVINSQPILLDGIFIPALCAWLKSIHIGSVQQRAGVAYRAMTFTLAVKDGHTIRANGAYDDGIQCDILDDWKHYILDKGNVALNQGNPALPNYGQPAPVVNADGTARRVPALLDGQGHALAEPVYPFSTFCLAYHLKPEKDFNQLPLW